MTIGMILFAGKPFPTDVRVEKECRALTQAGYRIIILTALYKGQSEYEETEQYTIVRVPIRNRLLCEPLSFLTLRRRGHKKFIEQFITIHQPDVLHVHDFDLVPTTLDANRGRLPVVADLHENGPASFIAFRAYDPPLKRFIRAVLYNYRIWKAMERRCLPHCSRVITVVSEAAERIKKYGVLPERIFIVSNTESEQTFKTDPGSVPMELAEKYRDNWVISYIGGLGPHRGIDTVIRALPQAIKTIPNLKFIIVGARGKESGIIERWAKTAKVSNAVEVVPWLPFNRIHHYLQLSKAALVPHNDFEHTRTTIPHKLFQYMVSGIPVLVSSCRPLERIVMEHDIGYVFQAGNAASLAEQLVCIHEHPEEVREKAVRAQKAVAGPLSWERDAKVLSDMYTDLFRVSLGNL